MPEDVAAGYHDPKDLRPLNNSLGGIVFGFGGLTTVLLGPAKPRTTRPMSRVGLWMDRAARPSASGSRWSTRHCSRCRCRTWGKPVQDNVRQLASARDRGDVGAEGLPAPVRR
jgi:hypothetical protein